MAKLDQKVIIITGATGGVGSAAAALFSAEGARLVLTGRDEARLREAASACDPERTRWIVSDNTDADSIAAVVALAIEAFGGLDGVFANAGDEGKVVPLAQMEIEEFDRIWRTNVRGPFVLLRHAVPHLIARGGGSVVVTSSTGALAGVPGMSAYGASKAGLLGLVRTAAAELGSLGVRVNALVPGGIENRMSRSVLSQMAPPEHLEAVAAQFLMAIPLRRLGNNEELARAALFLLSDDSSYCTGSTLVADGGLLAM
ncbi:MAG TPA: SDR family NAD(P)-dependent oxidoreductase [Enhygromyxa sp.]|nr:SDR family NAD(P)-dependent oxidoreductase [Enhygromyxa sp.]